MRQDLFYDAYDAFRSKGLCQFSWSVIDYVSFISAKKIGGPLVAQFYNTLPRDKLELQGLKSGRIWYLPQPICPDMSQSARAGHHPIRDRINSQRNYGPFRPLYFRQPFVTELSDAKIMGTEPIGFTADGAIIEDTVDYQMAQNQRIRRFLSAHVYKDGIHFAASSSSKFPGQTPTPEGEIDCACLLTNWHNHYGHWTMEHVLKLRAVERYTEATGDQPILLIESGLPEWKREFLGLMGYDQDDWVKLNSQGVRVGTLVIPSYPEPTPNALNWLRSRIIDSVPNTTSVESPERILIIRSSQYRRQFVNQKQVEDCLSKYGFESIAPEELSIAEQVQYFSEAEVIVGAHGSGLINMLWSKDSHIIELFGYLVACAFYQLASVLEHRYDALLCDHVTARHLYVDTGALSSLIETVIGS